MRANSTDPPGHPESNCNTTELLAASFKDDQNVAGSGAVQMNTERPHCGLGSFLPMSCRGRAEAFARRLQSRLQSLGRAGSGDGATAAPDETSWLTKQPEVTSHQPRLSSSSESDIYFDFDLECESPGSPVEETVCSETLPDCYFNKNRALHCPPRTQHSSESGCVMSPITMSGTSPDSDSSDGLYFDPENVDTEASNSFHPEKHEFCHETSPGADVTYSSQTKVSNHSNGTGADNEAYGKMNGHLFDPVEDIGSREVETRRVSRRNFRNAAGFRIPSEDKVDSSSDCNLNTGSTSECSNFESVSREGSLSDEYFECISPKQEATLSEECKTMCLHDSGYPNTAESSRCNSQNETCYPVTEPTETTDCSPLHNHETNASEAYKVPNGESCPTTEKSVDITEESPVSSLSQSEEHLNTSSDVCEIQQAEELSSEQDSNLENVVDSSQDTTITDSPQPVVHAENDSSSDLSTDSSYKSTLNRPSNLTIECSIQIATFDTTESGETTQTTKARSDIDGDDDDSSQSTPRIRRCSSLKTGKTPPGTPGRKKIVRFADVLGLDLADIRTFLDEIPKVPRSAYEDLQCEDISDSATSSLTEATFCEILAPPCVAKPERCLIPMFQQPGGQPDFMDRIREDQVCLENAVVTDVVSSSISGTVRVRNLDFHKSVHVRYTLDGWKTFADLQATYVQNSCDGFSDKFSFVLYAHTVQVGQRLEFAIRFQCKGSQYWDSNRGANYAFQCLPPAGNSSYSPIPLSPDEHFSSSFY
ncbi:glycogen-binding subunit 76A [Periplaneta americana]|uniref:glycogen-binding subunit 76A n=1 Tax=Periplaneta americana TaxID=6978 RepID=UPI0037E83A30